jgi:predicted dehydrogenase
VFSIIGSGFGLYGYLPSLVDRCAQRIVLPERYRSSFFKRNELARFAHNIQWERSEDAALDLAEGVVIAQRPIDQGRWINQCLARTHIGRLVLEKPLAPSPTAALEIQEVLVRSGRIFRMGYIFRYTGWGRRFLQVVGKSFESSTVSIRWEFMAHHFRYGLKNWKRMNSEGGGAVRFYGVQILALLAEAGYTDVVESRASGSTDEEVDQWTARFQGLGLPECEVAVLTRSTDTRFRVAQIPKSDGARIASLAELTDPSDIDWPQEGAALGDQDRRVGLLGQLCESLWTDEQEFDWYADTIELWRRVEELTCFSRGS